MPALERVARAAIAVLIAGCAVPGRALGTAEQSAAGADRHSVADGAPPRDALGEFSFSALGVAGQSTLTSFETTEPKGFAEVYDPVIETSMFVSRRVELGFSMDPWIVVRQPNHRDGTGRETVSAAAVNVVARWFFADFRPFEPYLEIADGPSYARRRVPSSGTQFNFLTELGAGLVFRPRRGFSWQLGYRLVHFSNAGLGKHNPSWNFNGLLIGGRWSYGGD